MKVTETQNFSKIANWVISERLPLRRSVASLTLKSDEREENHPVGVFLADVLDKNG
jgi:hypothetical protein